MASGSGRRFHIATARDVPSPAGDLGAVANDDAVGDPVPPGIASAYPNPTAGRLSLDLVADRGPDGWTDAPVEVFDLLGRRVLTVPVAPAARSTVDVDTSGLPAGLYVVRWGRYAASVSVVR